MQVSAPESIRAKVATLLRPLERIRGRTGLSDSIFPGMLAVVVKEI